MKISFKHFYFLKEIPHQIPYWSVLIFLIGIYGVVFPYISGNNLPGNITDSRFNLYVLEHFYLALTGKVDSFIDAAFLYPLPKTILFSDNHWGTGLIYAAFRWQNFSAERAFAYWFAIGFVLNYWAAFYASRKLELSQIAAAIAAFLFAFGLPIIAQDTHAQLLYRPYVPLAFLMFCRYTNSKNLRYGSLALLFLSLQFLTSFYSGLFLLYLMAAFLAVEIFLNPKQKIKNLISDHFSLKPLLVITASIAILILAIAPYSRFQELYNFKLNWPEIELLLPQIQSYFLADRSNLWLNNFAIFSQLSFRNEQQMFVGIGALIALAFLFLGKDFLKTQDLAFKIACSVALLICFTLRVGGFSLYPLLTLTIPGASSVKAVSREILVLIFPIGYLVGFAIDKIYNSKFAIFSAPAICAIICILIIWDPIFATKNITSESQWQQRLRPLMHKLSRNINASDILISSTFNSAEEIDAMLVAQKLNIKTLNGYLGNAPGAWRLLTKIDYANDRISALEESVRFITKNKEFLIDREKIIYLGFDRGCKN